MNNCQLYWLYLLRFAVAILLINEIAIGLNIGREADSPNLTTTSDAPAAPTVRDGGGGGHHDDEPRSRTIRSSLDAAVHASKKASSSSSSSNPNAEYAPPPLSLPPPPDVGVVEADGLDDLRRACITYDKSDGVHHVTYRAVYGSRYTQSSAADADAGSRPADANADDDYRDDPESFHLASRKNPWLRTTFSPFSPYVRTEDVAYVVHEKYKNNKNNKDKVDTANGNGKNLTSASPPPLMFIPAIFDPTHCLQDLLFSLLPVASRDGGNNNNNNNNNVLRDFRAVAVARPEWESASLDGRGGGGGGPVRDWPGDWCTATLGGLGWFRDVVTIPDGTCVDDLWVPPFMYRRFPRGWGTAAMDGDGDKGDGGKRNRGGGVVVGTGGNEYIRRGDLPLGTMHFLQSQMWKSFIVGNPFLRNQNNNSNRTSAVAANAGRIVFDTRDSSGRGGEWTNAAPIAAALRDRLDPAAFVVDVVDDVGAMTPAEQAALYHRASIVVAPGGYTLANVVFARPGSVVLELSCGEDRSWIRDWVSDLKIRHSTVRAEAPSCNFQGHRTYHVRPSALVDLILDICWKGMKKKKEAAE